MTKQAAKIECGSCDHALVSGVACDGQFEEWCEYLELRNRTAKVANPRHLYLVEVADLAAPGEFDAVRSET